MKRIAFLVLRLLLAAAFLMAASGKLTSDPHMVEAFGKLGLGQWFRYLTGVLEAGAAALLLPSATAGYAAALLVCIMAGAVLAHLFILGPTPVPALVLGLLSAAVAHHYLRQERN